MSTVYRKSAKGQREIETRADRLAPRLRTALILVDGRRSSVDLSALIQFEPEAALRALLDGGYVEIVSAQASPPQAVQTPVAAPAAAGAAGLAEVRRLAVRHLTDQLGPAAETAALRIERTRSWAELRPALEHGQRVLQVARGGAEAARFAARFLDLRPD